MPSRWTCSSTFGTSAALNRAPRARRAPGRRRGRRSGRRGPGPRPPRRAPASSRAWIIASGWLSPTRSPGAAISVRPTAWSTGSSSRRRPAAEVDDGQADGADVDGDGDAGARPAGRGRSPARRAGGRRGARGGRPGRRGRAPCGRSARRRRRRPAPPAGRRRGRPGAACARPARSVTSSRRSSRAAPVRWSIASRTSTALPGGAAQHAVHVGDAAPSSAARCPRRWRRSPRASSRASSRSVMNAPEPTLTSITSAAEPRRELLGQDRGDDQRRSTRPCRWRRGRRRGAGRRAPGRRSGR